MDGWQVLDHFSNIFPKLQKQIPVYILSSSCSIADIRKADKYSMVLDYLVKPLDKIKLEKILNELSVGK